MMIAGKTTKFILVAATGAALALAGCSKSSDNKGSGGPKGASKAAKTAFAYLPKDSAAIFGVSSGLVQGLLKDLVKSQIEKSMPAQFKAIKAKCGIDVVSDLKSVVAVMGKDQKDKTKQFVVVNGSFDKKKINDCVNQSEVDGKKLSAKADGKLTAYSREGDDNVFYGWWPSDNTVVFSPAPNNKAGVEALVTQKKSVADNKRLMSFVKDVNTKGHLWGVGDVKMVGIRAEQPDGTLIELDAGKELKLNLRLRYAEKASAEKAKTGIEGQLAKLNKGMAGAFIGPFLKDLKLSTKDNDAVIVLKLDDTLVKRAVGLMKNFGGMMGGRRR